jgi:hypothetical protein
MRAIVRRSGEIELWLDADFDAFRLALAFRKPRASLGLGLRGQAFSALGFNGGFGSGILGSGDALLGYGRFVKRQPGLRIIPAQLATTGAVLLQATRDFIAPVGLDAGIG